MEDARKGGLSKGCIVGLIIAGVLLVIVVTVVVLLWVYKDEAVKIGATAITTQMKQVVVKTPVEGVDSVQVNRIVDAFVAKVKADEKPDLQGLALFIQQVNPLVSDGQVTAADFAVISESMVRAYPDLKDLLPQAAPPAEPQAETPSDTLAQPQDSVTQ
jgi:hypothetical protein